MESIINSRLLLKRITQVLVFCGAIFVVIRIALQLGSVANAPTVGFTFLILVLLSAFFGDIVVSIITSIVAALCFNFFFLPPVGTFTIANVDDWVSLAAFLLTAIAISRLTSSAHNNSNKVHELDRQLRQLKDFSIWLLSVPHEQISLSAIAGKVVETFGVDYCSIHVEGKWPKLMEIVDEHGSGTRYVEIKQGSSPIGLLVVKGGDSLSQSTLHALGNMVGVRILRPSVSA